MSAARVRARLASVFAAEQLHRAREAVQRQTRNWGLTADGRSLRG